MSLLGTICATVAGSSVTAALVTSFMNRRANLELEKVKANFEHGRIVTKAQLDIELAAYREVWENISKCLAEMRKFTMTPDFTDKVPGSREEIYRMRLDLYTAAFRALNPINNALVLTSNRAIPFMSRDIAEAVLTWSRQASDFALNCMTETGGLVLSPRWEELRMEWYLKAHSDSVRLANLIRERLESIRILS